MTTNKLHNVCMYQNVLSAFLTNKMKAHITQFPHQIENVKIECKRSMTFVLFKNSHDAQEKTSISH